MILNLDPKCPSEILKMILEKDRSNMRSSDIVYAYAAKNTNCPPETLSVIVENYLCLPIDSSRKTSSSLAFAAFNNPNCPAKTITMVLKKSISGENRVEQLKNASLPLVIYAALNPNCPPELLLTVMKKSKVYSVRRAAYHNKNCPFEARKMNVIIQEEEKLAKLAKLAKQKENMTENHMTEKHENSEDKFQIEDSFQID